MSKTVSRLPVARFPRRTGLPSGWETESSQGESGLGPTGSPSARLQLAKKMVAKSSNGQRFFCIMPNWWGKTGSLNIEIINTPKFINEEWKCYR
jgi:hypothetical protein